MSAFIDRWRSRPLPDNLMLLAIALAIAIACARLLVVFATVPYAFYVQERLGSTATAGSTESTVTVLERIVHSGPATSWWGGRKIPFRAGGDYLRVLSHSSPTRTAGCALGVLVERLRSDGVEIDRVLTPKDEERLFGTPPGTVMLRPDGTTFLSQWASVGRYTRFFTDVPAVAAPYDPFLDAASADEVAGRTTLKERSRSFFVGEPADGGNGTWILLSRQGDEREFLLVPVEVSPVGDGL